MRNSIVTIVIPVYNIERYLGRCLESIINQTYSGLDIVLIDDCSTDNSARICDEWMRRDTRIRVIHKEVNEGAGIARNCGMLEAIGEYIIFIDGDDYIAPKTIERCVSKAKDTGAQAVVFGHHDVNAEGEITGSFVTEGNVFEGYQVREVFLPNALAPSPAKGKERAPSCARAVMFLLQPLKERGWHFFSEREVFSEDICLMLEVYSFIQKVAILPEYLYHYCENGSSITRSYSSGDYEKIKVFYKRSIELCDEYGYDPVIRYRLTLIYLSYTIAAMKRAVFRGGKKGTQVREIRQMLDDNILQDKLRETKGDQHRWPRKIIFFAMRHRLALVCWLLVKAKS